jgi:FMN phosphatase YigB (HAD superfamily)
MAAVDAAMRVMQFGPGGLTSAIWTEDLRDVYRSARRRALGLGEELPDELEKEIMEAPWTRVAPGSVEVLRGVARHGIPIAVVSNAGGSVEADLKAAQICQVGEGAGVCVAAVIDSSVVGVAKPDPAIFSFALDAAETPPQRAIFIGDSVAIDVEGARLAGIHGLHFDPYGFCEKEDHDDLANLEQLLEMMTPPVHRNR